MFGRSFCLVSSRAAAAVVVAGCRLALLERRCALDELVGRLRRAFPWSGRLAPPAAYGMVAGRLFWLLPPWGMGRCLKRSLILLGLWSGCGLTPRLVLGLRRDEDGNHKGHAWLEVADQELEGLAGSSAGAVATVEL